MALLEDIINDLNRPKHEMQSLSQRSVSPGLSVLAATSTPIGIASDIALARQNNLFGDFLNEDAERRAQVMELLGGLDPRRRMALLEQLRASQPTLEGTLAQPNPGRVASNSFGLLGTILGGVRLAGGLGRATGLLREPLTRHEAGLTGFGRRVFAERTGLRTPKVPQGGRLSPTGDITFPTSKTVRGQSRFIKDPKTGKFKGRKRGR